ncbi:GHKL domain-containing protein, partial [bacterium]|nr:GHKL domain-containing protein [bacterium]
QLKLVQVVVLLSVGPHQATTTIRDISQRKRLERELHRAQKELLKSHESLEKQVEQRTEELERFDYTVSHDLKSPLVTISGYLGMVEKDAISGNHERMKLDMKRIAAAANHMKTLLEEILELSQIGRTHAEFEEIQMTEMVEQIKQALAGIIAEQEVQISIDARLPTVMGDRLRISEVFQNLIENAIKYSREGVGPRVEIGARLEQVGTVFFVKDNGIGIAKRHFEKVFGLFDRVDITKEGTGIGLAIVSRIIELHGGKIWVESEGEGKGSTFCFTLPVVSTR